FTQDDAHIFCRPDDLYSEIEGVLDFVKEAMNKFGFTGFTAELSTRPEKFIGEKENWDKAESILEEVLKKKNFNYKINPGDGAFYGPKIDIKLKDALNREWQCATVQLDYAIPERFDLTYRDTSGKDTRVVMIHRVILGSLERFIATLIEHYAGKFPLWLSPTQVSVLNITQDTEEYAKKIKEVLEKENFRVEADLRNETLQRKIREKELRKVPYMVIVGKKELETRQISVRGRGMQNLGNMDIEGFLTLLRKEVKIA
ncbi:MAG: threonine--tRNA ligase, partial [Candidatus Omnitrophota bacterium]